MKQISFLIVACFGMNFLIAQTPPDSSRKAIAIDSPAARSKTSLNLFPNPAKNKVSIDVRGFEPGFAQVRITGINGDKIREEKRLLHSANDIIVMMFALSPGLYFISVRQGDKMQKKRLVVQ